MIREPFFMIIFTNSTWRLACRSTELSCLRPGKVESKRLMASKWIELSQCTPRSQSHDILFSPHLPFLTNKQLILESLISFDGLTRDSPLCVNYPWNTSQIEVGFGLQPRLLGQFIDVEDEEPDHNQQDHEHDTDDNKHNQESTLFHCLVLVADLLPGLFWKWDFGRSCFYGGTSSVLWFQDTFPIFQHKALRTSRTLVLVGTYLTFCESLIA